MVLIAVISSDVLYFCRHVVEALSRQNAAPPSLTEEPSARDVPALNAGDTIERAVSQVETAAKEHVAVPAVETGVQSPRPSERSCWADARYSGA